MFKTWQQKQGEIMDKNAQRRKHLATLRKIYERSAMYRNQYPEVSTAVQTWAQGQAHLLSTSTAENSSE